MINCFRRNSKITLLLQVCHHLKEEAEPHLALLQEDLQDLVQVHHNRRVSPHLPEEELHLQCRRDLLSGEGAYLPLKAPEEHPHQVGVKLQDLASPLKWPNW